MRSRLTLTVAFAASLLVATAATTAWAHYVYDDGYVWEGGPKCLFARSEVSHGNGGGYTKVDLQAVRERTYPGWGTINCHIAWDRPTSYLRSKMWLYWWHSSREEWIYCTETGYKYNTQKQADLRHTKYWDTPCGNHLYFNYGWGATYYDNAWRGGWMGAGYHRWPTSESTSNSCGSPPCVPSVTDPTADVDGGGGVLSPISTDLLPMPGVPDPVPSE